MANARSRFKQLLRSAEADLALLTRAACTLRASKPTDEEVFVLPDLQQQQQQRNGGSRGASAAPGERDSPQTGSTADSAGSRSSSSSRNSSSCSPEQLLEIRRRVAANLDAAESLLSSLRPPSGVHASPAAAADRAQARHFSDLLLAAREELAAVAASLDASIERRALLGAANGETERDRQRTRDREGTSSLLHGDETEEEADAAALGKERRGLLNANSSIQQMIDSGFAALQQLRGQRHRQQQQQMLLQMLGTGASGVRTLITSVNRARRRDKVVLGLVLGLLLVFTFLWVTKMGPN